MLLPTWVPGLEVNLAAFPVDGIRHQLPSPSMIVVNHYGALVPVAARPIDKSPFVYDESDSVPRPVGIVPDLGRAWLQVIDTSVPSHGSHDDSVPQ